MQRGLKSDIVVKGSRYRVPPSERTADRVPLGLMTPPLTMTLSFAMFPEASVTLIVHLPPLTGVTLNVASGPLSGEVGPTTATPVFELVAVNVPPYPVSRTSKL